MATPSNTQVKKTEAAEAAFVQTADKPLAKRWGFHLMAGYFSVKTAMLKEPTPRQHTLEMVILEDLVPVDHLLRKIDQHIDFNFIRDKVRHLYCDNNGRPAVDPVLSFKMLWALFCAFAGKNGGTGNQYQELNAIR